MTWSRPETEFSVPSERRRKDLRTRTVRYLLDPDRVTSCSPVRLLVRRGRFSTVVRGATLPPREPGGSSRGGGRLTSTSSLGSVLVVSWWVGLNTLYYLVLKFDVSNSHQTIRSLSITLSSLPSLRSSLEFTQVTISYTLQGNDIFYVLVPSTGKVIYTFHGSHSLYVH